MVTKVPFVFPRTPPMHSNVMYYLKLSTDNTMMAGAITDFCQQLLEIVCVLESVHDLILKWLAYFDIHRKPRAFYNEEQKLKDECLQFFQKQLYAKCRKLYPKLQEDNFWEHFHFLLLATWPKDRKYEYVYQFHCQYLRGSRPKFAVTLREVQTNMLGLQWLLTQFYRLKTAQIQFWKTWCKLWAFCVVYPPFIRFMVKQLGRNIAKKQ